MSKNRYEPILLLAIFLAFLGANYLAARYKLPSPDEPGYTDPAASWYFGQGFTSGAWYAQNNTEFFAGNVPLHHISLRYWFELFGFGIASSRAHTLFWVVLGATFLWDGLRRTGAFSWAGRTALICGVLFAESTYFVALDGRPDAITLFLACLTFWGLVVPEGAIRYPLLLILGFATPWAGIQLAVASGFALTLYVCFLKGKPWREWLVFACGGMLGGIALLVFYDINGVLPAFMASILPHAGNKNFSIYRFTGFWGDRSYLFTALAAVMAASFWLVSKTKTRRSFGLSIAAILAAVALPAVLVVVGKFPHSYCWMPVWLSFPLLVAWLGLPTTGRTAFWTVSLVLTAGVLVGGYPRILIGKTLNAAGTPPLAKVESLVEQNIRPGEVVIYSFPAFYAIKPRAGEAYYVNWYLKPMTTENREAVSVAVIDPSLLAWVEKATGARWQPASEVVTLPIARFLRPDLSYALQVFRRYEPETATQTE